MADLTGQFALPMASEPQAALEPARPMKQLLLKMFAWWNGQTFGTQLWTGRFGELVGADEQGNRYYRTKGGKIDSSLGFERRWVVYNGYAEATRVPPSWHGWPHPTVHVPPTCPARPLPPARRARRWQAAAGRRPPAITSPGRRNKRHRVGKGATS